MPTLSFKKIIKDIHGLQGKTVELKSIGKQLIFSCTDSIAEYSTIVTEIDDNLNKEQKALIQQNGEETKCVKFTEYSDKIVQGTFKMSYLMNIIKASQLCDTMNILFKNDHPLILEYYIADLGILRVLLLPQNP